MRLVPVSFGGPPPVDSYGPGFFRVSGVVIEGPLALLPGGARDWQAWDPAPFIAAGAALDVVLVGTGAGMAAPPEAFCSALNQAGIGAEPMATPAACRTYNVLLAEGRRIGAALLPV
jgi:uncharacterized protein